VEIAVETDADDVVTDTASATDVTGETLDAAPPPDTTPDAPGEGALLPDAALPDAAAETDSGAGPACPPGTKLVYGKCVGAKEEPPPPDAESSSGGCSFAPGPAASRCPTSPALLLAVLATLCLWRAAAAARRRHRPRASC
jgi:hypothetical protein